MIYFIQVGAAGPIKIGYARDIIPRLTSLQTAHHEPLRLLGWLDGNRGDEQQLHTLFAAHRIRGEWFEPNPRILAFVEADCHYEPPPRPRVATVVEPEPERASRVDLERQFHASLTEGLAARKDAGVSLRDMADAAGVSEDTAARWTAGRTKMPAEALGKIDALFASRGFPGLVWEVCFGNAATEAAA